MARIENIELKGINRSMPETNTITGACNEMVNTRFRNNAWRPTQPKKLISSTLADGEALFHHSVLPEGVFILVSTVDAKIYKYNSATNTRTEITTLNESEVIEDGIGLGNWFVFTSNTRHIRLLWDGTNYSLKKDYPTSPRCSINIYASRAIAADTTTGKRTYISTAATLYSNMSLDDALADYKAARLKMLGERRISGCFLYRVALELSDGTFICHGSPKFVSHGNTGLIYTSVAATTTNGVRAHDSIKFVDSTAGVPLIEFNTDDITDIKNNYSDEVKSVVIAVTELYNAYEDSDEEEPYLFLNGRVAATETIDSVEYEKRGMFFSMEEKINMAKDGNYFIVKRFGLDEFPLGEYSAFSDGHLLDIDWTTISSNETLSIDDNRYRDKFSGGILSTYNKRLILSNYSRTLSGIEKGMFEVSGAESETYKYSVTIKENDKFYTVYHTISKGSAISIANEYISYPHSGATYLSVYRQSAGGTLYGIAGFELRPHPVLNISYYVNIEDKENNFSLPAFYSTAFPMAGIPTHQPVVDYTDTLAISNYLDPTIYEARHSYTFGEGVVIGVGVPTFALSEGQFGEFPLYVFTSKGVWVLTQGSGEVLFASNHPISQEIALSKHSICGTELGVFFISEGGLFIINGSKAEEVSKHLRLNPNTDLHDDLNFKLFLGEELGEDVNGYYGNFPALYGLLSTESLISYSKAALVTYVNTSDFKEVLITNPSYNYSYVMDIETGLFHKTEGSYEYFVNNYPKAYGVKELKLYDISEEEGNTSGVLIETMPIKFNSDQFKKVNRAILRAYLKRVDKTIGFYLFVSYDSKKWELYDFRQETNECIDMYINSGTNSTVFIKMVIAGQLTSDSYISNIVAELEGVAGKLK